MTTNNLIRMALNLEDLMLDGKVTRQHAIKLARLLSAGLYEHEMQAYAWGWQSLCDVILAANVALTFVVCDNEG